MRIWQPPRRHCSGSMPLGERPDRPGYVPIPGDRAVLRDALRLVPGQCGPFLGYGGFVGMAGTERGDGGRAADAVAKKSHQNWPTKSPVLSHRTQRLGDNTWTPFAGFTSPLTWRFSSASLIFSLFRKISNSHLTKCFSRNRRRRI